LLSLVFAAAVAAAILWFDQILDIFIYVFRTLPGLTRPATKGFAENFAYYFVDAGLIPRTLGALIGHMSYAGIFGYFIGLAGLYRGAWTVPLLMIGWLLSSAVHAAKNAGAVSSPTLLVVIGIMSFVIFFTYYLKALPEAPGGRVARQ